MSARVACKGTGLVGAHRSMNVSREDPEPWTLEALICSTKPPRTCAVSAASAVAPVRGICDPGRPARCPLSASSAGRTRKPLPKPSGVSMPCAPGWPVWSVARRGGERPNGPACAAPHSTPECKGNYAFSVKEIMPLEPVPVSQCVGRYISTPFNKWRLLSRVAAFRVDGKERSAHNYIYTRHLLCPRNRNPTPRPWLCGNRAA